MASLPVAVLKVIFLQLFQRDLLECMIVCRQWHDIIFSHSLFPVIYINSAQELDKLIERVQRVPALGAKVKQLKLRLGFEKYFDDMMFFKCFPNLVEFALIKHDHSGSPPAPLIQIHDHPWCETIEKIVESRSNPNTMAVLNSGLCKNLYQLVVLGTYDEPIHKLVRLLANAPALKSLYLRSYSISFPDLEALHRTLPYLNTLSLQAFKFYCTSLPLAVVPATSVRSFDSLFMLVDEMSDYNTYYQYISQKYTEIEELVLDMGSLSPYNPESIQAITEYKAAIKLHLKALGHRLKNLAIHYTSVINNFSNGFDLNVLDECECQIKSLSLISEYNYPLLKRMPTTSQANYLQSLEIRRLDCDEKGDVSLEWLRQFTMLKDLNVTFSSYDRSQKLYTLKLSNFLELLSETKIETLTLNHCELDDDRSNTTPVYTSLKKLSLCRVTFKENMDLALSQAFVNMRHLKLNNCSLPRNTLFLPDLYLAYLEIVGFYQRTKVLALVNTLNNNQQRLYMAPKRQDGFIPPNLPRDKETLSSFISTMSKPYDKETDDPMLTITCKGLWSFAMENN